MHQLSSAMPIASRKNITVENYINDTNGQPRPSISMQLTSPTLVSRNNSVRSAASAKCPNKARKDKFVELTLLAS